MNTSSSLVPPPSKRIKRDSASSSTSLTAASPSPASQERHPDEGLKDAEDVDPPDASDRTLEQQALEPEPDQCTICLQPFLDRTIIPVCAHEFCFECILLWSEQSRKCPLCSRSFEDSYLIHRVRSQYDYQKHYLPPTRSSPPPVQTGESRVNALRRTRRERQWGRRVRQEREEADQLERAIARRRWIYQHHLYAKHIASNPFTRYRPFPTPAQFAASPDLIRRMTTFLRRELRVWPNLDVEFLTTYTIALMKSIDIRSESAVKLLSEFLDLDTPYTAGARQVNSEHFAHEIYSYLRSPYRDLNTYDQTAQYDTPPGISPPQDMERGSRWSTEHSPSRRSRSRSNSRQGSPVPRHENNAPHSPVARHGRGRSAEARREERPSRRHSRKQSPRSISPGREYHDPRNHPPVRSRGSPCGVEDNLRNERPQNEGMLDLVSTSAVLIENQYNGSLNEPRSQRDEKGKGQVMENRDEYAPNASVLGGDSEAGVDEPLEGSGVGVADDMDNVGEGSSANAQPSRKRSAGVHVRPRNRTLSESVQAYLAPPPAPRCPTKIPEGERSSNRGIKGKSTDMRPSLLLRLSDGPTDPDIGQLSACRKPTPNATLSDREHHPVGARSCILDHCSSTAIKHVNATILCGDDVDHAITRSPCLLPSMGDGASEGSPTDDRGPGVTVVPSVALVRSHANTNVILSRASASDEGHPETQQRTSRKRVPRSRAKTGEPDADISTSNASATTRSSSRSPDADTSTLETRLRTRVRLRLRLAAMKETGTEIAGVGTVADDRCEVQAQD